jgi:uncharacterized membrane protein YoaK (UPF0700 family)
MQKDNLRRGVIAVSIPIYIVMFYFVGNFLGEKYGNKPLWISVCILAGLILVAYDIYIILVRPIIRRKRKALK